MRERGEMVMNWKRVELDEILGRNSLVKNFTVRVVRHQNGLPREDVSSLDVLSLEDSRPNWMRLRAPWSRGRCSCLQQGV